MSDRKRMTFEEYQEHKARVLSMMQEQPGLMLVDDVAVVDPEVEKAIEVLLIERILRGER